MWALASLLKVPRNFSPQAILLIGKVMSKGEYNIKKRDGAQVVGGYVQR